MGKLSDMGKLADMGKLGAIIDSGEKAGIKAYHGSPHDFDEFSSQFGDSGAGAHDYGEGLYFSENEAIAKAYREGSILQDWPPGSKGHMYEVNLDADPDDLLGWDELIVEQPKKVLDKIKKADWWKPRTWGPGATGADLVHWLESRRQDSSRSRAEGGPGSTLLKDLGIKGVRYAAGVPGTRGGKRFTNYVIFDPQIIEISKKYGISIPLASAVIAGTMSPEEAQAGVVGSVGKGAPLSDIINSGGKAGMTALGAAALLGPDDAEAAGLGSIFKGQRISTRVPTAKGSTENPLTGNLVINRQAMEGVPESFDINTRYVSAYPTVKTGVKTPRGRADAFTAEAVDNLIWLYGQAPTAVRDIGKNWYVGANRISAELADKYGISRESASGVLAALSPQMDWYQNVSLAERVINGHKKSLGKVLDADSLATARIIYGKPEFADNIRVMEDTPFDDLSDVQKAMYLRSLDQTHNNRGYQIINPNGDRVGQAFSKKTGKANVAAWGSNREISKAIRVIEDPSIENISQQMGGAHKVRNFYNNISDPKYSIDNPEVGDVTIDTHAVAADQLMPHSGTSKPVAAAFGTAKGVSSSTQTGARGTYGLHADAYRIAAKELGIQPRELQSVTWETVRSLFPREFKTKGNVSEILEIWKLYSKGKLSKGLARELILDKAGGIPDPDWADGLDTAATGSGGLGSNTGELSFSGIPGGQNTRRSDAGRKILAAGLPVGIIGALGIGVSEDAAAKGSGTVVKPRGAPDDVAFKAARKPGIASLQQASNTSPALAALEAYLPLSQLGKGVASEIAGTLAGGTVGVGEYLRGLPIFWSPERGTHSPRPATAESIRNIREDVSRDVGGLYDAGPEAQDLGRRAMEGIGGIVGPTIDYAMEGPIMGDRGVNMLPLTAQALEKSYEGWKGLYDLLPEREQEAIISTTDVML